MTFASKASLDCRNSIEYRQETRNERDRTRQRRDRHHHRVVSGQRGARVTVIDRQPGAALETSYANAGQVSPGYSTPWAAPGIPLKA